MAAYARWAPFYDHVFGVVTTFGRRTAVAAINDLPAGRVLELGVGTGISLPLYRRDHRIVGIDLSPEMLARAERRVDRLGLDNVEALIEMDATRLAMPDASFDIAAVMFVMTVVPDPARVLAELARVVRPGGKVVLVNHFSAERGPRAVVERWLDLFAASLGWNRRIPDRERARPQRAQADRGAAGVALRPLHPARVRAPLRPAITHPADSRSASSSLWWAPISALT